VLILAVDTSTMVGGVALINDGALLGEHVLNVRATHSERLMSSVDATLTGANIAPGDLDAIACGVGPGSFTGVRIGVSAAKGMSYALGIPLVGVPTLDALAYGRSPGFSEVWSMIDARHGRCYVACYKPSDSFGAAKRILDYSVLDVSQIVDSAGAGPSPSSQTSKRSPLASALIVTGEPLVLTHFKSRAPYDTVASSPAGRYGTGRE
jgi:tRNA threonylcarbamoyladenosine biosynthesis protein TsaB